MSGTAAYAEWIAVDWGTSNLRAWAMRDGEPMMEASRLDKGMGALTPDQFEPALLEMVEPWLGGAKMTIVACGMVGARQGWAEAPYAAVPCPPVGAGTVKAPVTDPRLDVIILSGLSQISPPDVMRGEETQIAGYLAGDPDFDGILCLPGTHTKWVQISAGEVVSFRTYMTGELFALISKQSVLRHSMDEGWEEDAFLAAVRDGMADPQALAGRFFGIRAGGLVGEAIPGAAKARLSGLLIGAELAAAKPYWLGQRIVLLGDGRLAGLYSRALSAEGAAPETADVTHATLTGLTAAYEKLKEAT
ncbi:MAG: 2-dehydro-3-deoxygalactonokinase [Silicimonas sp.]|nr:2-dehydro-3-deoxygalactonokinase [Silicimonas sp.]